MTEEQALQIRELRSAGSGYKTIAAITGLSRDQVRNYCLKSGIGGYRLQGIREGEGQLDSRNLRHGGASARARRISGDAGFSGR